MSRRGSIGALALVLALVMPAAATAQKPAAPTKPAPAPAQKAAPAQAQKPPAAQAQKPATPAGQVQTPARPAARQVSSAPAARPAAAPASVKAPAAPAADAYSYRAEGRRDPFVSLLNRGTDPRGSQRKAEGLAGMPASDAVLKGILQSRGAYLAIVQGPNDKRQLIVRPNDRFADGVVKAITADGMLILQEVNDPLSLTKQREIRKTLRAVEEVK